MTRASLLIAVLAALAPPASAADLTDAVPGHPGLTAFDLVKLVVTDLAQGPDGASGHKVVPFRHIEGKDMLAPPEDPVTLGTPPVAMAAVRGSADRVLALIDLGPSDGNVEEASLLALIGFDPKPKLLDVVEVGNDRWTAMEDNPPLLAPGAPLIVIDSDHWNSNQTYNDTEIIFVRNDRFQLIDSRFTYSEAYCGYQHAQAATYGTAASSGPYRAVTVSVSDTTELTNDDCGDDPKPPKPGVIVYAGTYRWDAAHARFVSHSAALDKLDALNTKWLKGGS